MIRYCFRCGREAKLQTAPYSGEQWWQCALGHERSTAARHPWKISPDGTVRSRRTGEVLGFVYDNTPFSWDAYDKGSDGARGRSRGHPSRTAAARALWRKRYGRS